MCRLRMLKPDSDPMLRAFTAQRQGEVSVVGGIDSPAGYMLIEPLSSCKSKFRPGGYDKVLSILSFIHSA